VGLLLALTGLGLPGAMPTDAQARSHRGPHATAPASPGLSAPAEPWQALPRATAAEVAVDAEVLSRIDEVMREAIAHRETPGGVVLIGRGGKVIFERAYGRRAIEPERERATVDTIYDLASLTKVVATTPAVLRLVEQGRLRLGERLSSYLPEWRPPGSETRTAGDSEGPTEERGDSITLRQLLTHTSGLDDPSSGFFAALLPSGRSLSLLDRAELRRQLVSAIAQRGLIAPPGRRFFYSDLNFILLGEVVERVTGEPLDELAAREIFAPLGMRDTRFRPPRRYTPRIAPTLWTGLSLFKSPQRQARRMLRREASLQNVTLLAGVAGHAGLFSTVDDLARFCQALLNGGELFGQRVLSPQTVAAMSRDQAQLGSGELRGYGWDIHTTLSVPRGDLLAGGYGHTGWSGGSLWLVPEEQLYIIVLTNRVHPHGGGSPSPLRAKIANVVAASLRPLRAGPPTVPAPMPPGRP
jgi:CubicO group peptidase (beta-lactamase class C family)